HPAVRQAGDEYRGVRIEPLYHPLDRRGPRRAHSGGERVGQGLGLQLRSTRVAAIRVLVVDDHAVFCDALATILRTEADIEVVGSAARGEALIAPYMLARLLRGLQKKDERGPATPLTPRELEVLRELSLGHDNESVAKTLKMSPNTVRTHVQNILSKLNVHSKLEAVSRGIREGWIRITQEPAA